MFSRKSVRKGFTLIELLIVVAIIGILAAIAIPNFLQAQVRAKVARVRSDHRTLGTALETYYVDHNNYPWDHYYAATHGQTHPRSWPVNFVIVLSTPVDYVSSTNAFPDPFSERSLVTVGGAPVWYNPSYQYLNAGVGNWGQAVASWAPDRLPTNACMLKSFGPDHIDDGGEWIILGLGNVGGYVGYDRIYDPTNGTISRGDMVRLNGQIKGLSQTFGGGT